MLFVGLDVHKREVEACILDERGKIRLRKRFPCTRDALESFAKAEFRGDCRVALEATSNTWAVVSVIEPLVAEVVVSNPMRTRAIAEAKIKTDKIDAYVLAQLLRADFLPRVWRPDEHTLDLRRLTTHRASLIADRTRIKNRIQSLLAERLIQVPFDRLFSKGGLKWLAAVEVPCDTRAFLDTQLEMLASLEEKIAAADRALAVGGCEDPRVKLLVTLPGVNVGVAQSILATLGDFSRFKTADQAASYVGLIPSTTQSGDHCYHGPITKQGRSHARWMLVQAAQHLGEHPGPLGVFFRRLAKKKGRNVAVVAAARKLITIAWHMLKNNEPYRYAQPYITDRKLSRLRVAGGERRIGGVPKGTKVARRSGPPMRRIRPLNEVYSREGLPEINPPPGERNMIERHKLKGFVASISREKRVERRSTKKKEK